MAHILVVDDDPDVLPLLKVTLAKLGHKTTLVSRAQEGLAEARGGGFDLVLLDLMLPDLDGYEITRRLRADAHTRDLPILILTARGQAADREGAMHAGADAYLSKPFDADSLARKINELLKSAQALRAVQPSPGRALPRGRIIVSLGLRGGVGTTTFAVNLAGALARTGRRVCLVDLSPSGGHVALHLRLGAPPSWADLPAAPSSNAIAQTLVRHESGLFVMVAPSHPVRHGMVVETFQVILEALRTLFAEVVVDAAPVLDDTTCQALSEAGRTILVCSPEVGAVHTAIGTLQALASLAGLESQTYIALNHPVPEAALPQTAVEKALGRPPDLVIPYERLQIAALAQGAPLFLTHPGASLPSVVGGFALKL